MTRHRRFLIGAFAIAALSIGASADQASANTKWMRAKLGHSQAILGAVVTSNWAVLDKESRALALVVRDPAWVFALTEPEYLRQSDAFSRALQDLIQASAKRNLESAADAQIALTATCVRCHVHMTRQRSHIALLGPSTTDVGPDVDVVRHPPQKVRRLERIEDHVRASRIEIPHALRLPFRQVQSGHLGVLRLNQANPITKVLAQRLLHLCLS